MSTDRPSCATGPALACPDNPTPCRLPGCGSSTQGGEDRECGSDAAVARDVVAQPGVRYGRVAQTQRRQWPRWLSEPLLCAAKQHPRPCGTSGIPAPAKTGRLFGGGYVCTPPASALCHAGSVDDRLEQWRALPRRLYLDTGTLQTLFDYGDLIFDDEPFVATTRDRGVPNLAEEVEALRLIMAVNERAGFEFVVSGASIREVDARGEGNYASWVRDVLDTWLVQSEGEERVEVDVQRPGSVSARDWRLLVDALAHRSDAFLTMERRLFTQAPVVQRNTGLRVLRPTTYRDLLASWSALYT